MVKSKTCAKACNVSRRISNQQSREQIRGRIQKNRHKYQIRKVKECIAEAAQAQLANATQPKQIEQLTKFKNGASHIQCLLKDTKVSRQKTDVTRSRVACNDDNGVSEHIASANDATLSDEQVAESVEFIHHLWDDMIKYNIPHEKVASAKDGYTYCGINEGETVPA